MKWGLGRAAAGVFAWSAGAVAAITVGILALSLIGAGLIDRELPVLNGMASPQSPPASAAPRPSGSASPSPPAPIERLLATDAGSVQARCDAGRAYLLSWSPAQGYRVDDVRRGPALVAKVSFVTTRREYTLKVRCVAGLPQGTLSHDDSSSEEDH